MWSPEDEMWSPEDILASRLEESKALAARGEAHAQFGAYVESTATLATLDSVSKQLCRNAGQEPRPVQEHGKGRWRAMAVAATAAVSVTTVAAESVTAGMSPAAAVALSPRAGIGGHQWQSPFDQQESESMFACSHYGGFGRQHEVDAAGEDVQEVKPTIKVRLLDGTARNIVEPAIFALYGLGEVPKISRAAAHIATHISHCTAILRNR